MKKEFWIIGVLVVLNLAFAVAVNVLWKHDTADDKAYEKQIDSLDKTILKYQIKIDSTLTIIRSDGLQRDSVISNKNKEIVKLTSKVMKYEKNLHVINSMLQPELLDSITEYYRRKGIN